MIQFKDVEILKSVLDSLNIEWKDGFDKTTINGLSVDDYFSQELECDDRVHTVEDYFSQKYPLENNQKLQKRLKISSKSQNDFYDNKDYSFAA